jgi:hypothetical protein
MLPFVLLFVLWPFHHHKPFTSITIEIDPLASPDPDRPCVMWDKAFAYEGADHIVGLSPVSCVAAFENWRVTVLTPVDLA